MDVINLVTEDSIEHNMLQVLAQKQALADGVLDGTGDLKALKMPSGRRAFVERMAAIMQPSSAPPPAAAPTATAPRPPEEELRDDLRERHGEALLLFEKRQTSGGGMAFVVVLDDDAAATAREQQRLAANAGAGTRPIRVLDRATYEAMARLTDAGLVQTSSGERRELFRSPRLADEADPGRRQVLRKCVEWLGGAERKLKMALLLAEGGFAEEAMPVLGECLALAGNAQAALNGEHASDALTSESPAPPHLASEAATLSPSSALAGAANSAASMLAALRHDVTSLQAAE